MRIPREPKYDKEAIIREALELIKRESPLVAFLPKNVFLLLYTRGLIRLKDDFEYMEIEVIKR